MQAKGELFSVRIPINNHFYPETNKITTTKSLYDFVYEKEGARNIQFSYKGNIIPKSEYIKIPELGYEYGESFNFIEHSDRNVSIKLFINFKNKVKKLFIENQRLSNHMGKNDCLRSICRVLHTSPTNIINYSENQSENNENEIDVSITLRDGFSVYDVEYINATRQIWKHSKDQFVFEDESTIRDLKLCITAEFSHKINEIAFFSDNENSYNERTILSSTNDEVLSFIYTPSPNLSDETKMKHNIFINQNPFLEISFYEEYCYYQIAYLIEKASCMNKNNIIFNGKTINSEAKYQTISEIRQIKKNDPSHYNVMIDYTTEASQIKVRVTNPERSSFYDISLPIYATVSDLRKQIMDKENCNRYFGLVYYDKYLENNQFLFFYFIDDDHPIDIIKITPIPNKICNIYYFKEQEMLVDKKKKKVKKDQQDTQNDVKNFLIPINMTCQEVKEKFFYITPQNMSFSIDNKVYSDMSRMMSLDNTKLILYTKMPIKCYYRVNNKPYACITMNPDSQIRSLLKKVGSDKKFYNVQMKGKSMPFWSEIIATNANENFIITTAENIKIYDVGSNVSYSDDNIKKCFRKSVSKTIKQIHKQLNINTEFKLFSDFIELGKKDNPFLCYPSMNANTFLINSTEDKKTLNVINSFGATVQIKTEHVMYQKPLDFIIGYFGVPEDKLKLTYEKFSVPLNFSFWSFPDNATLRVEYPKNVDEYSQKFIYDRQQSIIPFQATTTLLDMKKMVQKKFDINDCSLNCISFKLGDKEIINSSNDNNANMKNLLSFYFVYPLSFVVICTPTSKNFEPYRQVKISKSKTNVQTYYFAVTDTIKDVKILLEFQEGVPVESICDGDSQAPLSDENDIPQSLIIKFRHYDVYYQGQTFSFEYGLGIKKATEYFANNHNLVKTDAVDYRITYRREFDNKVMLAKDQDLKRYNRFNLIRYFRVISIIYEKRLIRINTNLNETLKIRSFKRFVRNNINKPSSKILLSFTEAKTTCIYDDQLLGEIIRNDSPIYVFIVDSSTISKRRLTYLHPDPEPLLSTVIPDQKNQQQQNQQQTIYQQQNMDQPYQQQENLQQEFSEQNQLQNTYQQQYQRRRESFNASSQQYQSLQQQQQQQQSQQQRPQKNSSVVFQQEETNINLNNNIIINESDVGISSSNLFEMKNYTFRMPEGDLISLQLPSGVTVSEVKERIADFINEKKGGASEDVEGSSIDIIYAGETLKRSTVLDSFNIKEGECFNVVITGFEDIVFMTAKALQFNKEDLNVVVEEEEDESDSDDDQ